MCIPMDLHSMHLCLMSYQRLIMFYIVFVLNCILDYMLLLVDIGLYVVMLDINCVYIGLYIRVFQYFKCSE